MSNVAIFKRSDGVEFHAEEGSESFRHMDKSGSFERVDEQADEPAADVEPKAKPLSKMNRAELVAEAAKRSSEPVPEDMTKAGIIAAIEEFDARAAEGKTESGEPAADPNAETENKESESNS
jgi:hypothetical protein